MSDKVKLILIKSASVFASSLRRGGWKSSLFFKCLFISMANFYMVVFAVLYFFLFCPLGICIPRALIHFHYINEKLFLVKKK